MYIYACFHALQKMHTETQKILVLQFFCSIRKQGYAMLVLSIGHVPHCSELYKNISAQFRYFYNAFAVDSHTEICDHMTAVLFCRIDLIYVHPCPEMIG